MAGLFAFDEEEIRYCATIASFCRLPLVLKDFRCESPQRDVSLILRCWLRIGRQHAGITHTADDA